MTSPVYSLALAEQDIDSMIRLLSDYRLHKLAMMENALGPGEKRPAAKIDLEWFDEAKRDRKEAGRLLRLLRKAKV